MRFTYTLLQTPRPDPESRPGATRQADDGTTWPGFEFAYDYDEIGNMLAGGAVDPETGAPRHTFTANNFNCHVTRAWGNTVDLVGTAATDATVTVECNGAVYPATRGPNGSFAARVTLTARAEAGALPPASPRRGTSLTSPEPPSVLRPETESARSAFRFRSQHRRGSGGSQ